MEIVLKTKYKIIPLLITLFIAFGFTYLGLTSGFFNFSTVFIPEGQGTVDPLIGLLNATILIIISFIGAVFIYFLLKKGKENMLKIILFITFSFVGGFMLFLFNLSLLFMFSLYSFLYLILVLILSLFIGIILTTMIFSKKFSKFLFLRNISLMIFGALIGAFLGLVLPTWTSILLLIGLSLYDIYAVFKGPIKKIIELESSNDNNNESIINNCKKFNILFLSIIDYEIGLGDLSFYSMLVCLSYKLSNELSFITIHGSFIVLIPCLMSIVGIIMGAYITFKLLNYYELLPGLPISIGLGLSFFGLTILIFWII